MVDESTKVGVPEKVEKVNINDLLKTQEGFNNLGKKQDLLQEKINVFKNRKAKVDELEKELKKAKIWLEEAKTDGKNYKEAIVDEEKKFILDN
ncbi:MAG: hypothetical protein ACTSRG_14725 [Candidatus Helarchaeota archaeon]